MPQSTIALWHFPFLKNSKIYCDIAAIAARKKEFRLFASWKTFATSASSGTTSVSPIRINPFCSASFSAYGFCALWNNLLCIPAEVLLRP